MIDDEELPEQPSLKENIIVIVKKLWRIFSRAASNTAELERQLVYSLNPKRWPNFRQLYHSHRVFNTTERRIIAGCLVIIIAIVIYVGMTQILNRMQSVPVAGGNYTEGVVGQMQFINPLYAQSSVVDADISRLIFAGLFHYDADLTIKPDLAESYNKSDDGRIYTITMREGATWHDGEVVTVDDVIFTFSSITNTDAQSPLATIMRGVVVEKIDERNIRFTLDDPYGGFLDVLTVGIIPQHIWSQIPATEWRKREENIRPIGAGPWQFSSLTQDDNGVVQTYMLSRNNSYYGDTSYIDTLMFKFYPDQTSAIAALKSRNIEGLAFLSSADLSQLNTVKQIKFYELNSPSMTAIFFNLNQSSALQDIAVRQALRAGIDKVQISANILNNKAAVVQGALPNAIWSNLKNLPTAKYNKEEAKIMLEKAGWKEIGAIRQNKNGESLSVVLSVIDQEPDLSISEAIQKQWQELGVETKIDLISPASPSHIERTILRPRAYEALVYTIVYGSHFDPYPFWHSSQRVYPGLNLSLFSNQAVDKAIEQIRRNSSANELEEAYISFYKTIFEETPAIFLFSPVNVYAINDTIQGVADSFIATPADRFNGLALWYVKTKKTWK